MKFDDALKEVCKHGMPKVIVCPLCAPDKYALSEKDIERAKELAARYLPL